MGWIHLQPAAERRWIHLASERVTSWRAVGASEVRAVLVKDVGLAEGEALALL